MSDKKKRDSVRAGELLMMDRGEYSDYSVTGFYVALAEFSPREQLEAFFDARPEQRESYNFEHDTFVVFLIGRGLLMAINYSSIYLGSYSSASEFEFHPFGD